MSLVIRLVRIGRRHECKSRIRVAERSSKLNGRFLEELGSYDRAGNGYGNVPSFNASRYKYWIGKGAKPSEAVAAVVKHFRLISFADFIEVKEAKLENPFQLVFPSVLRQTTHENFPRMTEFSVERLLGTQAGSQFKVRLRVPGRASMQPVHYSTLHGLVTAANVPVTHYVFSYDNKPYADILIDRTIDKGTLVAFQCSSLLSRTELESPMRELIDKVSKNPRYHLGEVRSTTILNFKAHNFEVEAGLNRMSPSVTASILALSVARNGAIADALITFLGSIKRNRKSAAQFVDAIVRIVELMGQERDASPHLFEQYK